MNAYVKEDSIVRKIWGSADTILFIFAGSSAEFALNKAVDWLYFTGRLPSDPIGRLFSTVAYARSIVFADTDTANECIDRISKIHKGVESARGHEIPDWAYRDVLFMLIDYSIRSQEILDRKLSSEEKEEVFDVFSRMGKRMGLKSLPGNFRQWQIMRHEHLNANLVRSEFSDDLYRQYRKHLGWLRFRLLIEGQTLLAPEQVSRLLHFKRISYISAAMPLYRLLRRLNKSSFLRDILIPLQWKSEVKKLDVQPRFSEAGP